MASVTRTVKKIIWIPGFYLSLEEKQLRAVNCTICGERIERGDRYIRLENYYKVSACLTCAMDMADNIKKAARSQKKTLGDIKARKVFKAL